MNTLLEVQGVEKSFGTKKALKGVSLSIHQAEVFSLLGINGAGKTTLSSIIATLKPPTKGDLLFQGTSIYSDITTYRKNIGYCPQKPNLNPHFTLRQNLIFAGRYYGMHDTEITARIKELALMLEFESYLDNYPHVLSGGYKQRLTIARSIIHNPKLVILDEPTVALDPHIRHQIWEIIKTMKGQGISILLTTHYLDEAEILSDRVCVLADGLVRLIDTPKNLMSSFQKKKLEDVFLQLLQESRSDI